MSPAADRHVVIPPSFPYSYKIIYMRRALWVVCSPRDMPVLVAFTVSEKRFCARGMHLRSVHESEMIALASDQRNCEFPSGA